MLRKVLRTLAGCSKYSLKSQAVRLVAGAILISPFGSVPKGEAPRDGMLPGRWSSGLKQIFGTAYESYDSDNKYSSRSSTAPISRVWFTGTQGVISEVFWPTLDTPQVRDLQFLVTDGASIFSDERKTMYSTVRWIKEGVPAFVMTSKDRSNRFEIEKTIFTDPSRDVLIVKIKFKRNISGLRLHVLHNPAIGNTPLGDFGYVRIGATPEQGLMAYQNQEAQALVFSVPLRNASAAFSGPFDGYQDLAKNFKMTQSFANASDGEVVLTGELDLPASTGTSEFTMALGFATQPETARNIAAASLTQVDVSLESYQRQWSSYQEKVMDLSASSLDNGKLFRSSVAVLKSMEDKTYEGAFVACPCIPWGDHNNDQNTSPQPGGIKDRPRQALTGGYHLVWPRDLYQMATTMMALGDYSSAIASLNRLKGAQLKEQDGEYPNWGGRRITKNGSWPQNFWANGEIWWSGLQMDEVAMPVVLAYRLWDAKKIDVKDYWDMVSRAADLLQKYGPWTLQERWEESFGASPSTIAAEITALWTASRMAQAMGDVNRAKSYAATADHWAFKAGDNVDAWTFTTTGAHGNGRYFSRIEGAASFNQTWNPNDDTAFFIGNNGGAHREKDVLDGGFLELVRFGVKSPLDANIVDTLLEYDQTIKVDVAGKGPGWRRYLYDRYNYDDATGAQTSGMLWPLLTGERGHYELSRADETGQSPFHMDAAVNPYVHAMENFATATSMLPEQVWDFGMAAGAATGSATPLGWAHGEYIKLLRSKHDRKVFDTVQLVSDRVHAQAER